MKRVLVAGSTGVDYLDEVLPYIVDWLRQHLAGAEAGA